MKLKKQNHPTKSEARRELLRCGYHIAHDPDGIERWAKKGKPDHGIVREDRARSVVFHIAVLPL